MEVPLLYEIVIIFLLSIVVTIICNKLKLPATVGFLLTGVLCGPSLLGIVSDGTPLIRWRRSAWPCCFSPSAWSFQAKR